MNVKEFKEWLNQFPDDTVVEVIETIDRGYNGTAVSIVPFTGTEYIDENGVSIVLGQIL